MLFCTPRLDADTEVVVARWSIGAHATSAAAMAAGSRASATALSASGPISRSAVSRRSLLRPTTATRAPSARAAVATAKPMPDAPPITTTRWPLRRIVVPRRLFVRSRRRAEHRLALELAGWLDMQVPELLRDGGRIEWRPCLNQ